MKGLAFEKLMEDYKNQGFEAQRRRTTKLAKWALLTKRRKWTFGHDVVYLYFVEGDITLEHMNDFLKRYSKIHDENNFDDRDKAFLVYTGKLNRTEFRTLAKNILSKEQYNRMKLKKLKVIITKEVSTKKAKKKRVKKEEIIERRANIEEISVNSIIKEIRKWKKFAPKVTGKGKEKKMTLAMTGYLSSSFTNIILEQKLGKSKVDAVIGKVGIEAKYRPDQNEINRLFGQVDDYIQYLDHLVVVFFDTNQSVINNFNRKIKRGRYDKKVTIIPV